MRWLAALVLLLAGADACRASVVAVNIREPRTFGYFIGDTLQRDVEIVTDGNTEFLAGSLPRPGALTYWLDLTGVDHTTSTDGAKTINRIRLRYQIFYSALSATELDIPAFPLKFRAGDAPGTQKPVVDENATTASIPALKLTFSPLRNIVLSDLMPNQTAEVADVLRPNAVAEEIPTAHLKELLVVCLLGLLLSATALLYHYALWPFSARRNRPFTTAERKIHEVRSTMDRDSGYRASVLILHRAFDQAFGRRLFASDSDSFLAKNQCFAKLAPKLAAFFEASQLFFFGDDRSAAKRRFSLDEVAHLAAELAREERSG